MINADYSGTTIGTHDKYHFLFVHRPDEPSILASLVSFYQNFTSNMVGRSPPSFEYLHWLALPRQLFYIATDSSSSIVAAIRILIRTRYHDDALVAIIASLHSHPDIHRKRIFSRLFRLAECHLLESVPSLKHIYCLTGSVGREFLTSGLRNYSQCGQIVAFEGLTRDQLGFMTRNGCELNAVSNFFCATPSYTEWILSHPYRTYRLAVLGSNVRVALSTPPLPMSISTISIPTVNDVSLISDNEFMLPYMIKELLNTELVSLTDKISIKYFTPNISGSVLLKLKDDNLAVGSVHSLVEKKLSGLDRSICNSDIFNWIDHPR